MNLVATRTGRWLAPITQGIALLLVLGNTLLWLIPSGAEFVARNLTGLTHEPIALTTLAVALAWLISTLQMVLLGSGLCAMAKVFRCLANNEPWHPQVGTQVHGFGRALLWFGLTSPLFRSLLVMAVTFENPAGQKLLVIGISANDIVISLVGVLLMMLGYVLQEAAAIADDNRQII